MMPSSELIRILRTGAQGLDYSVRFLILDACDRLERQIRDNELLMQKIVELRSSSKWIPVTDRLPEYEEPVMGWDAEMRDMGIVNFIYGKFFDILDMSETNVTHWQYLPQPPKGE